MNDPQRQDLSEAGVVRRDQMLKHLKQSVIENQRRKKRWRAGAAVTVLAAVTSLAVWKFVSPKSTHTVVDEKGRSALPRAFDRDDSNPAHTLTPPKKVEPKLLEFELVSGDEILDLLNEVGKPSALAEINSEWVAIPLGRIARSQ